MDAKIEMLQRSGMLSKDTLRRDPVESSEEEEEEDELDDISEEEDNNDNDRSEVGPYWTFIELSLISLKKKKKFGLNILMAHELFNCYSNGLFIATFYFFNEK